jgi:hypothetical protein
MLRRPRKIMLGSLVLLIVGCARPFAPTARDRHEEECIRRCQDVESLCRGGAFTVSDWGALLLAGFIGSMKTSCSTELETCYGVCASYAGEPEGVRAW